MDIRKLKAALGDPSESRRRQDEYNNEEPKNELDEDSISEQELADRYNLLEKYGLKEMEGKDVEELLGSYDNASLDNKEIEKMERTLSKRIYQAILHLPSVKKVAVEVYIDNSDELGGIINIIVEYVPKGFLDRIMGTSNRAMDAETVEVTQLEISEVFTDYPEIVENFEIRVESF